MVETRMDVMVSQAISPAAADRVSPPAVKQAFQLDPAEKPKGVEVDVARIFAKRAFQPESAEKPRPSPPSTGSPRGQHLDIRA